MGSGKVCAVVLGLATSANAAIFYEPFDYSTGNLHLNVNPSVSQTWYSSATSGADDRVQVVSGSLNAPTGLPGSVGNMSSFGGAGRTDRIFMGLGNKNSGSVYYSLLLNVTDLTGAATGGATIFGFNNTAQSATTDDTAAQPSTISGRLIVKPIDANTFQIGIHKSAGTTAEFVFTDPLSPFSIGNTVFIVGRYTFGPLAGDDVFDLWVNPSASTFADDSLTPAPTITESAGGDTNQIATVILRQTTAVVPAGLQVDEIRADTTWARVTSNLVPEPASLGLLGAAAIMLARRRVRRSAGR